VIIVAMAKEPEKLVIKPKPTNPTRPIAKAIGIRTKMTRVSMAAKAIKDSYMLTMLF
jgi:hypothetical protein